MHQSLVLIPTGCGLKLESDLENGFQNQSNITPKAPIIQIVQVDFHLVGPDDVVVVPFRVGLLGEKFFLVAVFDAGRTRNTRSQLQDASVVALQLVGIAGHIGARPDETHLPDEDIDEFGEAVHLAVAQPMAHASDARIAGNGDSIPLRLMVHGAELADSERFAVFPDAPLHEKDRPFRVDFDENCYDEQYGTQNDKSTERHDAVEAPLEEESYFVFIFLHVAWPPC